MKKQVLYSLAFLSAFGLQARQLDPTEALTRALGNTPVPSRATGTSHVYTDTDSATGLNGVYVFNRGFDNGYIVVSADDNAPALLGYSDTGTFDPSDMAPNLRAWLNGYTDQIAYMAANPGSSTTNTAPRPPRKDIPPMCSTTWNQDAPYYNLCPMDGKYRSYTGCVATAMAQVMKYHNYPAQGIGSYSYVTETLGTTLSINFGSTTFDWTNMLDSYTSSATAAQNNAVATLMYACGVSVDMNYSASGSGASSWKVGKALIDYFGYDKGITYVNRDWVTASDWENTIYLSLLDYGPVIFGGSNSEGGHEFVCDGYNTDGYFHFNWGWGGMSDGYFLLSALNPTEQGIGGTTSAYSFNVDAITNICKPQSGSEYSCIMTSTYDLSGKYLSEYTTRCYITLSGGFYNYSYTTLKSLQVGAEINGAYYTYTTPEDKAPYEGYSSYTIEITSLPAGTYTLRPAFKCEGQEWQLMTTALNTVSSLTITKTNDGKVTIVPDAITLSTDDINVTSLVPGESYSISATLKNDGKQDYVGTLYFMLKSASGDDITLGKYYAEVNAGTSTVINYSSLLPKKTDLGDYTLYVAREVDYGYSASEQISGNIPVTVQAQSGIDDIITDSEVTSVEVYTTGGIKVAATDLPAGVYIIVTTHADGHRTTTKHIIK